MVSVNLAGGGRLIDALEGRGFKIDAAFWAKLSDEGKWVLYLSSPEVDKRGLGECYRLIHAVLRDASEWGIDPFSVTVFSEGNPMAKAAAELVKPKVPAGTATGQSRRPSPRIIRLGGRSLGGIPVDAAFIYPPWEPGFNPV
jgi:hypothetical protein